MKFAKLIVPVMVLLLFVGSALAADVDIDITSPSSLSLKADKPGSNAVSTSTLLDPQVRVKNIGASSIDNLAFSPIEFTHQTTSNFKFTVAPSPGVFPSDGSTYTDFANGENKIEQFTLAVPSKFTDGKPLKAGTYKGTFTATATGGVDSHTDADSIAVTLTVGQDLDATSSDTALAISAVQGVGSGSDSFTLTNTGNDDVSVTVSIGDLKKADGTTLSGVSLSKPGFTLKYGESDTVTLSVSASASQAEGTYTGTATATLSTIPSKKLDLSVTVDVKAPATTVTVPTEVKFGSTDTNQRGQAGSTTFVVTNGGDYDENVALALEGSITAAKYKAAFTVDGIQTSLFTLTKGQSKTVTLGFTVPKDQDSGVDVGIGSVKVTNTPTTAGVQGKTQSVPVKLSAKSMLQFKDIDTEVAGEEDENLDVKGDTIADEAKPEDKVVLKLEVENLFDKGVEDVELEDVEIEATVEGIDDGDDIEDLEADESNFDLKPGKDNEVKIEFTVPQNAEEGEYDIVVTVEGEDENGAKHFATVTLKLTVDLEKHDLRITEAKLSKPVLSCAPRTTKLDVTMVNFGSEEQEEAQFTISNSELGLFFEQKEIELETDRDDEDSRISKTIEIEVPESFKVGAYPIRVEAIADNGKVTDSEDVLLTVEECVPEEAEEDEEDTEVVVKTDGTSGTGTTGGQQPPATTGGAAGVPDVEGLLKDNIIVVVLLGLIAIAIIVIIILVAKAGKQ